MTATESVTQLKKIAEGREAEIFEYGDGRVLRLCRGGRPLEHAQAQAAILQFAADGMNGVLGGLVGADEICQVRAEAASLTGTWVAWLSTSSVNARDRIADAEYRRVDGITVVANDKTDLLDGTLDTPVRADEFGAMPATALTVWTGTETDGTLFLDATCANWTGAGTARAGDSSQQGAFWTSSFTTSLCNNSLRLYCFEL